MATPAMPGTPPLYAVQVQDNVWIRVDAATKLSAKLWLPQPQGETSQHRQRFSVVLEYLPYRKGDWTAPRDARNHTWMAQRGVAVARVDMRGSGNSQGYDTGEYTKEELDDGVRVIAWLAQQRWCTGSVGVFGKSWGGFNGLQLAAMAPPALKGVVSLYSIDDRYADDVHYMGGAVMGSEALSWASVMFAWNARPPAPEAVGNAAQWQAFWRDRLEHHQPWLHDWLAHQSRDAFWEHGSICESYASVQCPVLVIGGWADGYHNGVQRMMSSLTSCVHKGVIGPWSHDWPNVATPGPQVGFLEMCLQWWQFALDGDTSHGCEGFPDLQLYVKDAIAEQLSPQIAEYPGKWIGVQSAQDVQQHFVLLHCAPHGQLLLDDEADAAVLATQSEGERVIQTQSLQGAWSGEWLSFGGPDMPGNQASDDSLATTWTTAPLRESIEIVGYPEVSLTIKSSHPQALVAARLCDVSPSGTSTLISRGVLNLSHRDGHHPSMLQEMPVGEAVCVSWKLNYCAYNVPVGHRVVLAVTPHYWPLLWPSPEPTQLTVAFGRSQEEASNVVRLPVLPHKEDGSSSTPPRCPVETYPLDKGAPTRSITLREPAPLERKLSILLSEVDASNPQQQELLIREDEGKSVLIDQGIAMEETCEKRYLIDLKCQHPQVTITRSLTYEKLNSVALQSLLSEHGVSSADAQEPSVEYVDLAEHDAIPWKARVTTTSVMSSDAECFHLDDHLVVHLNGEVFFDKAWKKQIERHFV